MINIPRTRTLPQFACRLLIVLTLAAITAAAQVPGSPDLDFGDGGVARTPVWPNYRQMLREVVLQPDGKILAAGTLWLNYSGGPARRFMLLRYNADGSLDTSFANEGIAATWFREDSMAESAALLPDGDILVVGRFRGDLAIARYDQNGMKKHKHGGANGLWLVDLAEPGFTSDDLPAKIILRPDGGFYIVSIRNSYETDTNPYYAQSSFVVSSHNADGSLDTSFASGGKFVKSMPLHNYSIFNVKVEPDGTFFVHGNGSDRPDWMDPMYQPRGENVTLKFGPNGLPDASFGKNGTLRSSTSAVNRVLQILPDGKLIASNGSRVVRMDRSGSIEQEIVNAAQITVNGQLFMKRSYISQPDGKIIAQGIFPDLGWRLAFVRFLPTGEVDTKFGTAGLAPAEGASFMGEHQFLLQDDGKILHIGQSAHIILSRYHGGQ